MPSTESPDEGVVSGAVGTGAEIGFVRTVNGRQNCPVPATDDIPWFSSASRRKRWLVGVSGGADSVALLHLLVRAGFPNLVVCHLDHRLRGRASTEDSKFVKRLAEKLGLPCEVGRADVGKRMSERSESMETAARHSRHAFFAGCAEKHRCRRVLLAHHADDQAETVLWNLLRGSQGLKGMRGRQDFTTESGAGLEFHRPLLGVRRSELVDWLVVEKLQWREDASNSQAVAVRNRLRHEAIPLLGEISGRDPVAALARGAADAEEIESLVQWALARLDLLDPQGRLHLGALRLLPAVLQRLALRKFLIDHRILSPDRGLVERAMSLLEVGNPAIINLPGGGRFRRREGRLWIEGQT